MVFIDDLDKAAVIKILRKLGKMGRYIGATIKRNLKPPAQCRKASRTEQKVLGIPSQGQTWFC